VIKMVQLSRDFHFNKEKIGFSKNEEKGMELVQSKITNLAWRMAHHLRNVGDRMRNGDFLDVMLKYPSDGEGEDSSLKRNRSNKFSSHHGNNNEIRIVEYSSRPPPNSNQDDASVPML